MLQAFENQYQTTEILHPEIPRMKRNWLRPYTPLDLLKRRGLWLAEMETNRHGFKSLGPGRILEIEQELIERGIPFDIPKPAYPAGSGFIHLDLVADSRH